MRDHDLERIDRHASPRPERHGATPDAGRAAPFTPGRSPGLDAASLMHLQRTAGNAGVLQLLADEEGAASPVHDVVGSGGAPLDTATRSTMESAFGQSFEDVRVHTDAQASKSAESVGANAYTVGSDVVFRSGHFDPSSATGQRTLAHELTHVVQQRSGPVDGTDAPGGIRLSDPSDRFEQAAESSADQVMASVQQTRAASSSSSAGAPVAQLEEDQEAHGHPHAEVQRQMGEEEEELQA